MIIKKYSFIFALIICVFILPVQAFAYLSGSAGIDDKARLYSANEITALEKIQTETAVKTGWNIAVVTTDKGFGTDGYDAIEYAENYYYDTFGKGTAGVLYLIDIDYRHIVVEGNAELYFNDNRINAMLDETEERYMAYDDVGNLEAFYKNIDFYYSKGYYTNDPGSEIILYPDKGSATEKYKSGNSITTRMLIGLIAGLIAAGIGIVCVLTRYKLHHAPSANAYMNRNSLNFYRRSDMFVREFTTRTRIDSSSGGGSGRSGGGSHHSSGGHSSGGGGRGGRR